MDDNNHDYSEGLTSQTELTEVDQIKTEASNEVEKVKKKSAWKWLLSIALLLTVGFIIALTPSFAERLPDIAKEDSSKKVSYSSSSTNTSRSSGSSSNAETAIVSYAALSFAVPVMVAVLTFLTLLNTLLFLSMNLNLKDIRRDMQEMYEDFTKKA